MSYNNKSKSESEVLCKCVLCLLEANKISPKFKELHEPISIKEPDGSNLTYQQCLTECTEWNVKADLSTESNGKYVICGQCSRQIINVYKFLRKARENDKSMRKVINDQNFNNQPAHFEYKSSDTTTEEIESKRLDFLHTHEQNDNDKYRKDVSKDFDETRNTDPVKSLNVEKWDQYSDDSKEPKTQYSNDLNPEESVSAQKPWLDFVELNSFENNDFNLIDIFQDDGQYNCEAANGKRADHVVETDPLTDNMDSCETENHMDINTECLFQLHPLEHYKQKHGMLESSNDLNPDESGSVQKPLVDFEEMISSENIDISFKSNDGTQSKIDTPINENDEAVENYISFEVLQDDGQHNCEAANGKRADHIVETDPETDEIKTSETEIHTDVNTEFDCELCGDGFHMERHLFEHYKQEHEAVNWTYSCEICNGKFFNSQALMVHANEEHLKCVFVDCSICGCMVSEALYSEHYENHAVITKYHCTYCGNSYFNSFKLYRHIAEHLNKPYHQCPMCGNKFQDQKTLQLHQRVHMRTENSQHMKNNARTTIQCPFCEKRFERRADAKVHVRFHRKDFPFECEYCDKRFAVKGHLTVHQNQHTGTRYKCTMCEKNFLYPSGLREHMYTHTTMPYKCDICSKGFPTKFKARRHIKHVHIKHFDGLICTNEMADVYVSDGVTQDLMLEESIEVLDEHRHEIPAHLLTM